MTKMLPLKPFLLRAYYDWICASGGIPHLLVQADLPHVQAPPGYMDPEDGTILFNISSTATNRLELNVEDITFEARFEGKVFSVQVPMYAVCALYDLDTEEGIFFELNAKELKQEIGEYIKVWKSKDASSKDNGAKKITPPPYLRIVTDEESPKV